MTKKEIETRIKQEENRVRRLEDKLADIQFDIAATKRAVEFWKKELEKVEGK
jgi:chromosome segregation ATPase